MDLKWHNLEHVLQELSGRLSVSCRNELGDGEFASALDADEETELAFGRPHFGDVNVKEPDGIALELLPRGLVSRDIQKMRDAVTLQAGQEMRSPRDFIAAQNATA